MLGARYIAERKELERASTNGQPWLDDCFPEQLAFIRDESEQCAALCTRRAGKTYGLGVKYIDRMHSFPGRGELSVYVSVTAGQAQRNLGPILDELIARHQLPVRQRVIKGQLYYEHSNGHLLWLAGCKDRKEAEKIRGAKLRYANVDEPASMPDAILEYLVHDCLEPALSDRGGQMSLTGTPGVLPVGFFWEATTGAGDRPQWPTHAWTLVDNPHHIATPEWMEALRAKRGWELDNPTYLREYCGKWVADSESIIYPYLAQRNAWWGELPAGKWFHAMSVDLGWNDDATFTVSASRAGFADVYYLKSSGRPHMTTAAVAAEIQRIRQEYPIDSIVVDTGGLGRTICEDLGRTYGIPAMAADKRVKAVGIRALADGLRAGTVHVAPAGCEQLIGEWQRLPWNDTRTDHHPNYADHCSDGAVYGYRAHPIFETWDHISPEPGTPEAKNAWAAEQRRKALQPGPRTGRALLLGG